MFSSFSPKFESSFRIFFIVWVSFWTFLNLLQTIWSYASFSGSNRGAALGEWWLNTIGAIVAVALGIILLFYMNSNSESIRKNKKLTGIPFFTGLAIVYYLFLNVVKLISTAVFKPDNFADAFIFGTAWLLPSLIIMVIHILYFVNLSKYNEELASKPVKVI